MRKMMIYILVLAAFAAAAAGCATAVTSADSETVVSFDVAEDMTRFMFDEAQVHEDGMPDYGSAFVTQGYIYPAGTLDGTNGVNLDGSPEFPDKVLGEWTCYGYMIGDGAYTEEGAWVISSQIFNFGEGYGDNTLVSQGYEIVTFDVPVMRAITGGTGQYAGASGQAEQKMTGFNATEGVVLTVEFTIE